jgi:DNA helicase-2/ATP-dependent DNA helicase PcrA
MRQGIPFIKRGGLKFLESAHVKDLISFLRLAENPRDLVAGTRVLKLLPGVGPAIAKRLMAQLVNAGADFRTWRQARVPAAAMDFWPDYVQLLRRLANAGDTPVEEQIAVVRQFYVPLLEQRYDSAEPRKRDLEQVEVLAARYKDRRALLTEMALDPPSATQDLAGPSQQQEDYLVLSTIHSAKGLERDSVYVIHASDGNIPSARSLQNEEQLEEELRLFYVALTRARRGFICCSPCGISRRHCDGPRGA